MSTSEYDEKLAEILKPIPREFHGAIACRAWDEGHAYGHDECLNYARSYAYVLAPCIEQFRKRMESERKP